MESVEWHPIWLSLEVASAALVLTIVGGTLTAWAMAGRAFWGKDVLEALLLLPLVLPPVVVGYVLLLLLGRNGPVEQHLGLRLLFTPTAAVLASATVAFPLMYSSAKAAFVSLDGHLGDAAQSLGASPARVLWTVLLPLAWPGLVAGTVLSFARALGEFGATIIVAGNIAGQTTTVPLAIYNAAEGGDLRVAGWYSLLLGGFNLIFIASLNTWTRHRSGLRTSR